MEDRIPLPRTGAWMSVTPWKPTVSSCSATTGDSTRHFGTTRRTGSTRQILDPVHRRAVTPKRAAGQVQPYYNPKSGASFRRPRSARAAQGPVQIIDS